MGNNHYQEIILKSKYLQRIKAMVDKESHINENGHYDSSFKFLIYQARQEGYSLRLLADISAVSLASIAIWCKHNKSPEACAVRELQLTPTQPERLAQVQEGRRFRLKFFHLFVFDLSSAPKFLEVKLSKPTGE